MTDIVERLRQPCHPDEPPSGVDLERREAADEIERLREACSDGALRDVLWGILTPDDGTAPPPNYTLVQLARDRMSDIERLRERLHYCTGVNGDRWKEIERLRAALREIADWPSTLQNIARETLDE